MVLPKHEKESKPITEPCPPPGSSRIFPARSNATFLDWSHLGRTDRNPSEQTNHLERKTQPTISSDTLLDADLLMNIMGPRMDNTQGIQPRVGPPTSTMNLMNIEDPVDPILELLINAGQSIEEIRRQVRTYEQVSSRMMAPNWNGAPQEVRNVHRDVINLEQLFRDENEELPELEEP